VNIYDQRPDPSYGTGGIVNVAKVSPMPKAGGKWNTYEITAKGSQLTVVLNGVQTVDVQDSQHAQGPFASSLVMVPTTLPAASSSGARCRSSHSRDTEERPCRATLRPTPGSCAPA